LLVTRITCIVRPHLLEQIKTAIAALGVSGLNVADVRGTGNSTETTNWFGGDAYVVALPIKSKVEVVVPDSLADSVVEAILANARTGEPGDGKVFIERIEDALRIRTAERGDAAL
jgi:nitrogen regulatory protein P-II 1